MPLEIERKFLVTGTAWRSPDAQRLVQGYLSRDKARTVRVRIAGPLAFLTIKGATSGASRAEFEYPVPLADAEALMALACDGRIDKIRHLVQVGAHLWEIDEFRGDNAGLVVAEIELSHADEPFERPSWLGREVTDERRYYNLALAARPFAQWTAEEKAC